MFKKVLLLSLVVSSAAYAAESAQKYSGYTQQQKQRMFGTITLGLLLTRAFVPGDHMVGKIASSFFEAVACQTVALLAVQLLESYKLHKDAKKQLALQKVA